MRLTKTLANLFGSISYAKIEDIVIYAIMENSRLTEWLPRVALLVNKKLNYSMHA